MLICTLSGGLVQDCRIFNALEVEILCSPELNHQSKCQELHLIQRFKIIYFLMGHGPQTLWVPEHWEWVPSLMYLFIGNFMMRPHDAGSKAGDESLLSFNSLWLRDAIWRQRSGSTLAQVMACCLTAPSHYLNQCWLVISEVQWHS